MTKKDCWKTLHGCWKILTIVSCDLNGWGGFDIYWNYQGTYCLQQITKSLSLRKIQETVSDIKNFVEELRWRGMIHDMTPGTEEQLQKEMTSGYIGFDPTADSLHIGNLVPIMLLVHLQRAGHKPFVLVGGATGQVGDPSGKTEERQLLSIEKINHNLEGQKKQLMKFLDFEQGDNNAEVVNNYDWFKDFNFLDFIRDVGKHITVCLLYTSPSPRD